MICSAQYNLKFYTIHLKEENKQQIANLVFLTKKGQFAYNNSQLLCFFKAPKLPLTVPKLPLTVNGNLGPVNGNLDSVIGNLGAFLKQQVAVFFFF